MSHARHGLDHYFLAKVSDSVWSADLHYTPLMWIDGLEARPLASEFGKNAHLEVLVHVG